MSMSCQPYSYCDRKCNKYCFACFYTTEFRATHKRVLSSRRLKRDINFLFKIVLFRDTVNCEVCIASVINDWALTIGGMTMIRGNQNTRRNTCSSATTSTTTPTFCDLGLNLKPPDERPATNNLSHYFV